MTPSPSDSPLNPYPPCEDNVAVDTLSGRASIGVRLATLAGVVLPFAGLGAAIGLLWGWGFSWVHLGLLLGMYIATALGITVGYHRLFTHGSFKANRPLRIALAIAGSLAIEGPVIRWVADHRRHHAYSDREGDPHSPWRYGETLPALLKGLGYAHIGWMFDELHTNREKYTPDLLADCDIARVDRLFPLWLAGSLLGPALLGGLISWSWTGALSAFFWASLVRIFLLHHVTWSINSICHAIGQRPFNARDKSTNFWPLALFSFGESWHNLHHADPTSARHGVLRRQVDSSARLIRWFERLGWAWDVRWPDEARLEARRAA